jgi:uncharacterized protein
MRCPVCPESTLVMTDRSGIEIDYCPQCRGVWLDRGELDKIIERSAGPAAMPAPAASAPMAAPVGAAPMPSPGMPRPAKRDWDDDDDDDEDDDEDILLSSPNEHQILIFDGTF